MPNRVLRVLFYHSGGRKCKFGDYKNVTNSEVFYYYMHIYWTFIRFVYYVLYVQYEYIFVAEVHCPLYSTGGSVIPHGLGLPPDGDPEVLLADIHGDREEEKGEREDAEPEDVHQDPAPEVAHGDEDKGP